MSLKGLWKGSLSLRAGVTVLQFAEGLDLLKLASRCLRTLIGTSSEQQQLDQELRDCLLAMTRF